MQHKHSTILAVAALILAGCGGGKGGGATASRQGSVGITIVWPKEDARVIPSATKSILLTLTNSGAGLSRTKLVAKPIPPATLTQRAEFTDVPTGLGYVVKAQAMPNADGTGTPLAENATASFEVLATNTPDFAVVMDSTVTLFNVSLGGATYAYNTATSTFSPSLPSGRLTIAGQTELTIDTRNSSNVLVLGDAAAPAATGPIAVSGTNTQVTNISHDPATASAVFRLVPQAVGDNSLTVTYTVATGTTKTFGIPTTNATGSALSYDGTMFPAGKLIRGTTYAPSLVGSYTYSLENVGGQPNASTLATINPVTGAVRVKDTGTNSSADQQFTVVANYTTSPFSEAGRTTLTIGRNQFSFQQSSLPPFKFGSAVYTLKEPAPGNGLHTGFLTGTSATGPITVENHARTYVPTIEYYSGPAGTGAVLARLTGAAGTGLFGPDGTNSLVVAATAGDSLVTELVGAKVGGLDLAGFTFTGGKTYAIVPSLKVTGVTGDLEAPFTLVTADFGAQATRFHVQTNGTVLVDPPATAAPATTTITLEYRKNDATPATGLLKKTFNVTIKQPNGGIVVGIG